MSEATRSDPGRAWADDWTVAAASVTGTAHLERSLENQDSFQTNLQVIKDPLQRDAQRTSPLIVSVADGLGSGRFAAAGSALATALSQRLVEADLSGPQRIRNRGTNLESVITKAMTSVAETWTHTLLSSLESIREFRTTLIVAVLHPPWVGVAQIGDGMVVLQKGKNRELLLVNEGGPVHAQVGTTAYLSEVGSTPRIFCRRVPSVTGIAVSTDGLEDSLLHVRAGGPRSPKREFFDLVFAEVATGQRDSERMVRLLRSPKLRSETDDDLTLVVAARKRADLDDRDPGIA